MTETLKDTALGGGNKDFLTMTVAGQLFGIPVLQVQDVLGARAVTKVPLAQREIAGAMNLRGRIVTVIDLRRKLQMPDAPPDSKNMYVVIDHKGELYSLVVDSVGEVLSLPDDDFEKTPGTIDGGWREVALGIYRLEGKLLVILDVPGMLDRICLSSGGQAA